jgi:NAD(P) transhydrogenase subunit alpha
MRLLIVKPADPQETRIPMLPADAGRLKRLGAQVEVEAGVGAAIGIADAEYGAVGAMVSGDRRASLASAEMVLRMDVPGNEDIDCLAQGCVHVSYLDPFNNPDVIKRLAARKVSAISLEMIPRTTIAQKMDVLSSQANLAGYVAVILAAERHKRIFPMMTTPAGTIAPARVFVIGAGVAGLQAIATAKRLGARVDAFDVRAEVHDQIRSLGAKPLVVDLGETGQTKEGYAKQLTGAQLDKQREAMAHQCALSDVVVTTARVFGRKSPRIVTNRMLDGMKPGSIVVDLAVETGGNVEASELGKEVERNGVLIIGLPELQRRVPIPASQMFSGNLANLVEHFWDREAKRFKLDPEDEIIRGCLITHQGQVVHPAIKATV